MEEELTRRQLVEEVQAQFEKKLREAKRQKSQAEEELESASERWRNERRKLNAEIDRLEGALTEAKAPSKQKTAPSGIDPEEVDKIKAAGEERFNSAFKEWQVERSRLESQASRLEDALVEALERSGNPIRSVQPIKDHFESQLQEAEKDRIELEQEFLRAKAQWDEEKKKLTGDLIKLRRMTPSKALEVKEKIERLHGRKESVEETRIKELEQKLEQANTDTQRYHQASLSAKEEAKKLNNRIGQLQDALTSGKRDTDSVPSGNWTQERNVMQAQIQQLQKAVDSAQKEAQSQFESRLEKAARERAKLEDELATNNDKWDAERRQLTRKVAELEQTAATAATSNDKLTKLQEQLTSSAQQWNAERRELTKQIEDLQQGLEEAKAWDDKRAKLEGRIAANAEAWEAERRHLDNQIVQLQQSLAGAKDGDESGFEQWAEQWATERGELQTEIQKLRSAIRERDEKKDDYEIRLEEVARAKTKLEEQLEFSTQEWEVEREVHKSDIARLQEELAGTNKVAATSSLEQWNREREELQDRIQELNHSIVRIKDEVTRQYEPRLQDAQGEIAKLEGQIDANLKQADVTRNQLLDQVTQLQQEIAFTKNSSGDSLDKWAKGQKGAELQKLRIAAARAKEEARLQYESKLEEAFHERAKLEEQMTARTKELEAERQALTSQIEALQRELSQTQSRGGESNEECAKEREELQNDIRQLQRSLSEGRHDDIVEQLRKQYDQKIQDMIEQKTQLSRELLSASTLLQTERERFASEVTQASGTVAGQQGLDPELVNAEVERVERVLHEITSLIDDPATELSMVIRKNVEKAEHDAYLKGILFSMGRIKGLKT